MSKIKQFFGKKDPILIDYGSGVKVPKFSSLRDPLQYEDLQLKVEAAATIDANSKALDKYIFHKDGVHLDEDYKTQFEKSLPDTMLLEQSRLIDIGRRDATYTDAQNLILKSKTNKLEALKQNLNSRILDTDRDIQRETLILDGKAPGASGLMRPGRRLVSPSKFGRFFSTYKSLILKTFAAGVDVVVVMQTIAVLMNDDVSGVIMGMSAVLIQVLVPHLIGEKLFITVRSAPKDKIQVGILVLLILVWLSVVAFLTYVRFLILGSQLVEEINDVAKVILYQNLIAIFTASILVGLGLLIIWDSYKTNKHEINLMNLEYRKSKLKSELTLVEAKLEDANARILTQAEALRRLDDSLEAQEKNVREIYPYLGHLWYRRKLTNEIGDPNFTTEATK